MSDEITLPRSVVEQLVDPLLSAYRDIEEVSEQTICAHCKVVMTWDRIYPLPAYPQHVVFTDSTGHAADCPVRIAQEVLRQQSNIS